MAKYEVLHRVEIGGKDRRIGDVIDAKEFAPAPEVTPEQKAEGIKAHLSEVESLLSTGHIKKI